MLMLRYKKYNTNLGKMQLASMENTVLFLVSSFQYVLVAVMFTVGPPYRESMLKNYYFMVTVTVLTLCTLIVTLYPPVFLFNLLGLVALPISGKLFILLICFINFGISLVGEKIIFPYIIQALKHFPARKRTLKLWKQLEKDV